MLTRDEIEMVLDGTLSKQDSCTFGFDDAAPDWIVQVARQPDGSLAIIVKHGPNYRVQVRREHGETIAQAVETTLHAILAGAAAERASE